MNNQNAYRQTLIRAVNPTSDNNTPMTYASDLPRMVVSSKHNSQGSHVPKSFQSKNKKKGKQKKQMKLYVSMPPEFVIESVRHVKRRFETTSTALSTLSIFNLWNMDIMAVSTILGFPMWRACKITRVEIWCPVATQGVAAEISLTPISDGPGQNLFVDLPKTYTDSTISVDRPAYIDFRPTKYDPCGSWHLSNNTDKTLIDFNLQTGSVVDIHLEVVDNLTTGPLGFSVVIAGATQGKQYCRGWGSLTAVAINTI